MGAVKNEQLEREELRSEDLWLLCQWVDIEQDWPDFPARNPGWYVQFSGDWEDVTSELDEYVTQDAERIELDSDMEIAGDSADQMARRNYMLVPADRCALDQQTGRISL